MVALDGWSSLTGRFEPHVVSRVGADGAPELVVRRDRSGHYVVLRSVNGVAVEWGLRESARCANIEMRPRSNFPKCRNQLKFEVRGEDYSVKKYAVVLLGDEDERGKVVSVLRTIDPAVFDTYDQSRVYFLRFSGTTRQLADQVGFSDAHGELLGIVLPMEGYAGYASRDLWNWAKDS